MKWLDEKIYDYHRRLILATVTECRYDFIHTLFSGIGLDQLKELVEKGELNRKEKGHTDYTNLAQLLQHEMFIGTPHRIEQLERRCSELIEKVCELNKELEKKRNTPKS